MMSSRLNGKENSNAGILDKCYRKLVERWHRPMIQKIQKQIKKVALSNGFKS